MLRARRYRVVFVFTAIFVLVILHFTRSGSWDVPADAIVDPPEPQRPPVADSYAAPQPPQSRPPPVIDKPTIPEVKQDPQEWLPGGGQAPDDKPTHTAVGQQTQTASVAPTKEAPEAPPSPKKPENQQSEPPLGGHGRIETGGLVSGKPVTHWKKLPEHYPLDPKEIIKLPSGKSKTLPKLQARFKDESVSDKITRQKRLSTIRESFEHAWNGYKTAAMGHDEVYPVRGGFKDPFNGWGATLVDALDTLWIMDLRSEFSAAVDEVKKIDFTTSLRADIPLFETTIRYLGGLLGAYDISGHKYTELLDKAKELADILIGAFDTPNRMPVLYYRWAPESVAKSHVADVRAVLAELGSLSVEFTRLAQLAREDKYYDAIARITNELEKVQNATKLPGLWPLYIDASGCRTSTESTPIDSASTLEKSRGKLPPQQLSKPGPTDAESYKNFIGRRDNGGLSQNAQLADYGETRGDSAKLDDSIALSHSSCKEGLLGSGAGIDTFGLGALADSVYEYLPKEYMLLGGLNEQYRSMYEKAMDATRNYLLFQPMVKDDRDLRFVSTVNLVKSLDEQGPETWTYKYEGTHLTCFVGGMFAVGAKLFEIEGDLDLAAKLTEGCVWAYESTATGIMPESFQLLPCEKDKPCTWNETAYGEVVIHRGPPSAYKDRVQFVEVPNKATEVNQAAPASPPGSPAQGGKQDTHQREAKSVGGLAPTTTATASTASRLAESGPARLEKRLAPTLDDRIPPGFVSISGSKYILRPEAIESVFLMYRLTGDKSWREKGWKMFEAISKHTRTELAHSAIYDVTESPPRFMDGMESFWLAETLKYFYLLFSDPSVVNLDEYVLNTEAHPLKRPQY